MTDQDLSDLAIIVVNYGSSVLLGSNLVTTANGAAGCRVVVVDNYTTAEERAAVAALCVEHSWEFVSSDTNLGFGVGMNVGVARAAEQGCTWYLLLNPDAVIAGTDIALLLERAQSEPFALVMPTILRPDGTVWSAGSDIYLDDGRIRSVRRRVEGDASRRQLWLSGACLLVGAELWDRIGGFSDDYFLYWEDVDLSWKVKQAGGSLVIHDTATAVHAEGGTQGEGHASAGAAKSNTYYYYNIRNRLVFASRNLSDADIAAWMSNARTVAKEILLQGGRRQFLRPWGPLSAARRGTRDGLRIARAELESRSRATRTAG